MGSTADWDEMYLSAANSSDKFAFATQARLKDADGNAYNLTFPTYHQLPDLDYHVRTTDLGRVDSSYRGLGGQSRFGIGALPAYFGRYLFKLSELVTVPGPHAEYFSAGIPFHQTVEPLTWTQLDTMRRGEHRSEVFAAGVIGPSFDTPPPPSFQGYGAPRSHWAYRTGDVIDVRIPMLVDTGRAHLPAMQSTLPIPGYAKLYRCPGRATSSYASSRSRRHSTTEPRGSPST